MDRTPADLRAVVQDQATRLLPDGIRPVARPASSGTRRVAQGLRPISGVDLVHGLDVDLPLWLDCPAVATVHDLSVFDTPWAFSRYRSAGERWIVTKALDRADAIIAVSNFTAERIEHHFGRSATVVPLAPPEPTPRCEAAVAAVRLRYDLPPRFVLQLASIEPRKDVASLAEACSRLDVPLILAGARNTRIPLPSGARHLGYVRDADVDPLLDAAAIVAYISLYEGFGLPPLEAMTRRRPVVATAVGALPDVAADGACLVQPGDTDQLALAIEHLWHDDEARAELAARAVSTARRLTWAATVDGTLQVYRSLGVAA